MKIKFYSIIIFLIFLTSCENYAQQKNDLQKEKLSGKVKSIKVNSFSAVEKFGEIVKVEKLIGSPTNIDGYSDNNEQINFNEKGFIVVSKNDFINITYSYNTKNQIIEENRYSKDGSILYGKKTFIYAKDKLKEEKTFDYNPTESITEKVINFYDGLGNLMKSINYNGNGKLSSEVIYKYDKLGNQIEIKGLDSIGETSFLTKYKFDSRKNQIEERDFNEDGSFKLIKKKFDNYQNILEINTQDMPIVAYTGNISKFKYSII